MTEKKKRFLSLSVKPLFVLLLGLVLLSWVISLIRKISAIINRSRCDRAHVELFADRVREARRNGESAVRMDGLWD